MYAPSSERFLGHFANPILRVAFVAGVIAHNSVIAGVCDLFIETTETRLFHIYFFFGGRPRAGFFRSSISLSASDVLFLEIVDRSNESEPA